MIELGFYRSNSTTFDVDFTRTGGIDNWHIETMNSFKRSPRTAPPRNVQVIIAAWLTKKPTACPQAPNRRSSRRRPRVRRWNSISSVDGTIAA